MFIFYTGAYFLLPLRPNTEIWEFSKFKNGWQGWVSVPGTFKMDHLQPNKPFFPSIYLLLSSISKGCVKLLAVGAIKRRRKCPTDEPRVQRDEVHLRTLPWSLRHRAPHRVHEYPLLREGDVEASVHRVSKEEVLYSRPAALMHLQESDLRLLLAFLGLESIEKLSFQNWLRKCHQ